MLVLLACGGAWAGEDDVCLECHASGGLDDPALEVPVEQLRASIHGQLGLACTDCHQALAGADDFPHGPGGVPQCESCHESAAAAVDESMHSRRDPHAPPCWTCHGGHDVFPTADQRSKVHPLNQPQTCLSCHSDPGFAKEHRIDCREEFPVFQQSVHYQAIVAGNGHAPACSTCHGGHRTLALDDPHSTIHRDNLIRLCGTCHGEILAEYEQSVHAQMLAQGDPAAPTCIGCHQEHAIRRPHDPDSSVSPSHIAQTCSHCHDDESLAAHYGLTTQRLRTYLGSYHGAANRFGDTTVANCASCHGAHNILPSSDPRSSIHPSNLQRTCSGCHPQAGQHFATGKIHVRAGPEDNYWAWLIKRIYVGMIYGVIGFFVLFILADLWWRARRLRVAKERRA